MTPARLLFLYSIEVYIYIYSAYKLWLKEKLRAVAMPLFESTPGHEGRTAVDRPTSWQNARNTIRASKLYASPTALRCRAAQCGLVRRSGDLLPPFFVFFFIAAATAATAAKACFCGYSVRVGRLVVDGCMTVVYGGELTRW